MADLRSDPRSDPPAYDEKHLSDTSSDEKQLDDHGIDVDDGQVVKEVEALEDRIANDEATDAEYRVEEAWEVAIKVLCAPFCCGRKLICIIRSCRRKMTQRCRR